MAQELRHLQHVRAAHEFLYDRQRDWNTRDSQLASAAIREWSKQTYVTLSLRETATVEDVNDLFDRVGMNGVADKSRADRGVVVGLDPFISTSEEATVLRKLHELSGVTVIDGERDC